MRWISRRASELDDTASMRTRAVRLVCTRRAISTGSRMSPTVGAPSDSTNSSVRRRRRAAALHLRSYLQRLVETAPQVGAAVGAQALDDLL